jgi:hypothetical protein
MASATKKSSRMSDEAVQAKTGKTWNDWFKILDKAGAKKMNHQEIVAYLRETHGVGPWWQQMVTVTYEQARGWREKHETATGYSMSASKTISVSLAKLYKACREAKMRGRWLNEKGIVIRKATAEKSKRLTWRDGKTSVELRFYAKGNNKSQIVADHNKLQDAKAVAKMKTYWAEALGRLQNILES